MIRVAMLAQLIMSTRALATATAATATARCVLQGGKAHLCDKVWELMEIFL